MTLGVTVEALLSGVRGGPLRMGLSRVEEGDWLRHEFDRAARARVFADHPEAVAIMPGAEDAAHEAAMMVAGTKSFAEAARSCWEDLCVLQSDGDGAPYRLTAGALGFPTDWRLEEKVGHPLSVIHAPIHGYATQLSEGVDHFFRTAPAGQIFGRSNWFVVESDVWRYLPQGDPAARFAHVTADNAGDTLFVRCERQTLRRLPGTGAMLFTICIAVEPLRALGVAALRRVADALATVSEGEHGRRGAPFYAEAFARYTDRRENAPEKATA